MYSLPDHSWGYLSLLPNLIMGYGWNPGKRIFNWFGRALAARPKGHADITFAQVYKVRLFPDTKAVPNNISKLMTIKGFNFKMFNVRLAGGHLCGRQLFAWRVFYAVFCAVLFPAGCLGWDLGLN